MARRCESRPCAPLGAADGVGIGLVVAVHRGQFGCVRVVAVDLEDCEMDVAAAGREADVALDADRLAGLDPLVLRQITGRPSHAAACHVRIERPLDALAGAAGQARQSLGGNGPVVTLRIGWHQSPGCSIQT